jgi:hypothetical protein
MGTSAKDRRLALRLALYIRTLNVDPVPFDHSSYKSYVMSLNHQYVSLKNALDSKLVSEARTAARLAIRQKSLEVAAEGLVPRIPQGTSKPRGPRYIKSRLRLQRFFEEWGASYSSVFKVPYEMQVS